MHTYSRKCIERCYKAVACNGVQLYTVVYTDFIHRLYIQPVYTQFVYYSFIQLLYMWVKAGGSIYQQMGMIQEIQADMVSLE